MKKITYLSFFFCAVISNGFGQEIEPSLTENHIHKTIYKEAYLTQDLSTFIPNSDKLETIIYYDGLGREKQTILLRQGGNYNDTQSDIIMPSTYDIFGRQSKTYLPLPSGLNNGSYNASAIEDLNSYYGLKYPEDIDIGFPNPFSKKIFEKSPISRVLIQGSPGKNWLAVGNGLQTINFENHPIRFVYKSNNQNEVPMYSVIFPTGNKEQPSLYYNEFYAANQLYKTITLDENYDADILQAENAPLLDNSVKEFKDKQGRVILKRTYNNDAPHDTHYVYDDFGNLTYVMSPKGSDQLLIQNQYTAFDDNLLEDDKFGTIEIANSSYNNQNPSVRAKLDTNANTLEVSFNVFFSSQSAVLNTGAVLALPHHVPDIVLGTITAINGSYTVSVIDGFIHFSGSGNLSGIYETFIVNLPEYSPDPNILNSLCYQYHYDYRNRLIEKKIPGKDWEYIVYDKLDRPVLTQDAYLRADREWLFTKYDAFNRVVLTGILKDLESEEIDRESMQQYVGANPIVNESSSTTENDIKGYPFYYTNNVLQLGVATQLWDLYTVNYYDDYNPQLTSVATNPTTVLGQSTTTNVKSLPTGSRVKVMDGTNSHWVTSVTYYDDKARPIYAASNNSYLSTTDVLESQLDFTGKVLQTKSYHTKDTNNTITVTDNFTYDHANRPLTQNQQINQENEELIFKNTYDELGQLISKGVGGIESSPLQSVDYTYNIRGWLRSINDVDNLGNDLFSFKIGYNNPEATINDMLATKLYNGNISETIWKTASLNGENPSVKHSYKYHYDSLNRLKVAEFGFGDTYDFTGAYKLYVSLYDKNGNIKFLYRNGKHPDLDINTSKPHDKLDYTYEGNQLVSVDDLYNVPKGYDEGSNPGAGIDYTYDANGNLKTDAAKDISSIGYNHLNLPTGIGFSTGGGISYIYDAIGTKLKKRVNENGNITSTRYAGNYIYEETGAGEELKFFSQPEGYIEPNSNGGYNYTYQYKDHLGNIRLSYQKDKINSVIIEEDFTNSTYDWDQNNSTTINNNNNEFNVTIIDKWNSTSKYVSFVPEETIHIEFDFENIDMEAPKLLVREKIDGVWEPLANRDLIHLNSDDHYELDLNLQGDYCRIYFEKGNASDDGVASSFKIDNLVITQNIIEIIEENNYYPFGLKHKGYNGNVSANSNSVASKFKYNGIEFEEGLGLNLYEMDMRNYDPAIARWNTIDPVVHFEFSPYNAFDNNPVFWSDPSGADGEYYNWNTGRYENDKGEEVSFGTALASQGLNTDGSELSGESPDDTFKVGKNGKIVKVDDKKYYDKNGKEVDKLISEKTDKSKFVDKNVLNGVDTDESYAGGNYQYFYMPKSQKSTILFNWLATNTDVEFSLLTYSSHAYISTSFSIDSESGGVDILRETINEGVFKNFDFVHSHPSWGSPLPSGYSINHSKNGDKVVAQYYQKTFPHIKINWSMKKVGKTNNIKYNYKKVLN